VVASFASKGAGKSQSLPSSAGAEASACRPSLVEAVNKSYPGTVLAPRPLAAHSTNTGGLVLRPHSASASCLAAAPENRLWCACSCGCAQARLPQPSAGRAHHSPLPRPLRSAPCSGLCCNRGQQGATGGNRGNRGQQGATGGNRGPGAGTAGHSAPVCECESSFMPWVPCVARAASGWLQVLREREELYPYARQRLEDLARRHGTLLPALCPCSGSKE